MKRTYLVTGTVLVLLVAAAAFTRFTSSDAEQPDAVEEPVADAPGPDSALARKDRVRQFWALYREATQHRMAGRRVQAVRGYEEALRADSTHEDALYYLGNMYLELGRRADAERLLTRLVEVNPRSARAYSRLGDLYLCFGGEAGVDVERGRAAFEQAVHINQEETGPLLRLGQLALIDGQIGEARRRLGAVLDTNPGSVEGNFFGGYAAWKQGDRKAAARLYEQAVQPVVQAEASDKVIGEGDRKAGTPSMLAEYALCPLMQHILADATQPPAGMEPAFRRVDEQLAALHR